MVLAKMISEETVNLDISGVDKWTAIEILVDLMMDSGSAHDREAILSAMIDREKQGSTGLENGVAIPHGKMNGVRHPIISFGRSKQGLDFDSMDGQPAHLFFLLIAPEDSSGIHLQVLARIAKILKNRAFRQKLMAPGTRKELYQTIIETDEEP